jgi:single-strand DNA-binding protein
MATNEKRRDKTGDLQDITTWFRITLWNRQAENASKYLQKGSPVYIEGRLKLDEWTDRDGNIRQTLDVTATDMQFIGGGRGGSDDFQDSNNHENVNQFTDSEEEAKSPNNAGTKAAASEPVPDDDIPF